MNKRTKFNVSKKTDNRIYDGIIFASALEMKYYCEVVLPKIQSGEIKSCELQKVYILQERFKHNDKNVLPIIYKADFYIIFADGSECVIDTKGFADPVAKMKRKMFWYTYPNTEYHWISFSSLDGGWVEYETILKGRKARKEAKIKRLKEQMDNGKRN